MAVTSSSQAQTAEDPTAWLTPDELRILGVVCDTLFPSLEPPSGSSEAVSAFYRRKSGDVQLAQTVAVALATENEQVHADFKKLLGALESSLTGLMLGQGPRAFTGRSQQQREKYLLAMANSPVGQLRLGFQAIKRLAGFLYFAFPDTDGRNPNWQALDYTPASPTPPANATQTIKPLEITADTDLAADVVVIGSGAGGGVVAAELAQAGKSVIVLEKGGYQSEATFSLQEAQSMQQLYLGHGLLATKDLSMAILAGSTLGGGTVVNWTTSFRTPPDVLENWAKSSGLSDFTGSALQDSFAEVEKRISVNRENSAHNRQNQLLADGCAALGYHQEALPRNAVGCDQRCGTCGFGCRYGAKQSTLKTYLQDAFDQGARIVVNCNADRVLIEQGRAVGVKATAINQTTGKSYNVVVRAKVVVSSAGSINSPALLLRSGLDNPHIGRHLHLHPVSTIAAVYPDKVYPWNGVMQSAYSDEFAHLDGSFGYKLEVPPVHPGLLGLATPWHSAREYREHMLQAPNTATIIVLTRDRDGGQITLDAHGEPVINYLTSVYDRKHLLHGMRQAARVHFAAGARAVLSLHSKKTVLEAPADGPVQGMQLRQFERELEQHGLGANRLLMFSAHQMGTCRMGADPKNSVTDGNGEVHGVKGLFVCDGSLFPESSGVNPMLSIMALSHRASQYIKTVS